MNSLRRPLMFGLVGPGEVADSWLAPALGNVPGAALWSVAGRNLDRTSAFAAKHGALSAHSAHGNFEKLLEDPEIDAVIIATPDGLHARQAIAAARAGKHVFVEKPMATTVGDAVAMVEACEKAGVKLGVGFHNRWHAGHRKLAALMHGSSALGDVRHMRVHWSSPAKDASNWRAGSDAGGWWSMAALGSHCIDLVRWLMVPKCGEVTSVRAHTSDAAFKSGRDEMATVLLKFASGATAEVFSSVATPRRKHFEIEFAGSSITATNTLGAHGAGEISLNIFGHDVWDKLVFEPVNPYEGELNDFVEAVRQDRTPEVGGVEGMRNVALLCMAEEDAKRKV